MRCNNAVVVAAVAMVVLVIQARRCIAHPGYPASALIVVYRDGQVIVHVRHDALAFALNETPALIGDEPMRRLLDGSHSELELALQDGRDRFVLLFQIVADGQAISVELIESPTAEAVKALDPPGKPARLPMMLEFVAKAHLPPNTRFMSLAFPEVMGDVIATIERPGEEPFSLPLLPGERVPEFSAGRLNFAATAISPSTAPATAGVSEPREPPPIGPWIIAWRYVALGFTHIVPSGLDHVLFVLGLFFASPRLKALLTQVTAFTLAHSVTLALATLGVVRLPAEIIEPIIAASIAFIAVENLLSTKVQPWRPVIVFAFGLVHGLGFAGVLAELGLPRQQLATALVSFNVGVELGQLAVISTAFLVVGHWRNRTWYRPSIALPASAIIGCAGLWWTLQRVMGF